VQPCMQISCKDFATRCEVETQCSIIESAHAFSQP
jgi:hypothetical protein